MRLALIRDANLAFAITAVLLIAAMSGLGWDRSVAVQRAREATRLVNEESRLLEALGQSERASEQAYRSTRSGHASDLQTFEGTAAGIHRLAGNLRDAARDDRGFGRRLVTLANDADADELILERQAGVQPDGRLSNKPPAAQQKLPDQDIARVNDTRQAHDIMQALGDAAWIARDRRQFYVEQLAGHLYPGRWLGGAISLLGIAGMLAMVLQLCRAWQRLRQAEAQSRIVASQLRASLDSLNQGVAVFSETGALVNWNRRLGQILDLSPNLLQRGLPYSVLGQGLRGAQSDTLEPIATILADAPGLGDRRTSVYERTLRRSVAPALAHGALDPIGQAQIQVEFCRVLMPQGGFVLTVTDMTERVQSERLMRESQKMQALGQLTGGIAHDFNNMLTVILSSLEISPQELAIPVVQQVKLLLSRMHRASQAAASGAALTRQLLGFARKRSLVPEPADLSKLLPELMPLIRHTTGDAITVVFEMEPALWPAIVDIGQLQSAVLNLALNARDAMKDGGRLTVAAGNIRCDEGFPQPPDLPPGDYVRLRVADTGHGMSRDVIARAFEPFFTTKPEGHGTGLGLAMVFSFASQSGGRAVIESELGIGTMISLYLPRSLTPAVSAPPAPALLGNAPRPQGASRQPLILLVDDDSSVREVTADTLRGLGYRVSEAADSAEALRLVRTVDATRGPFDLLLTDIMLPGGLDGKALAARVGALSPTTQLLFMSGSLERPVQEEQDGEPAWLAKPFRRKQLADAVDRLISRSGSSGVLAAAGPRL